MKPETRLCINPVCRRPFSVESPRSPKLYCVQACRKWKGVYARRPASGVRDTGKQRSIA